MYSILNENINFLDQDILNPKFDFNELINIYRKNPVHESTIQMLVSILDSSAIINDDIISKEDLEASLYDYIILGNSFLYIVKNYFNENILLKRIPALNTRIKKNGNFIFAKENKTINLDKKRIIHLKQYAIDSDPYGAPSYISAKKDIELINEIISLRIRFCKNNANLGGILVISGDEKDRIKAEKEIKKTKNTDAGSMLICAVGNDKNPKDALHLIEQNKKYENEQQSSMLRDSRDNIHIAHRVPQDFIAAFTNKNRDEKESWKIFYKTTIMPIQIKIARSINKKLKSKKIDFLSFLNFLDE